MKHIISFSSGHGMSSRVGGSIDIGATANGYKESTLTRRMCKNLAIDFARLNWKVLDRDTGHFSEADNESAKFGARVFVEYHINAAAQKEANGAEVWISSGATLREKALATNVLDGIVSVNFKNRGVKKSSSLAALHEYEQMDSILVEPAFLTNKNDILHYLDKEEEIELRIVNAIQKTYGLPTHKTLPRKWGNVKAYLYRITHR